RSLNAATRLHEAGQSLWLDYITRGLLDSGDLARYIASAAVTGLTSNPTIFDKAITGSADYDEQVRQLSERGLATEELFFQLAIEELIFAGIPLNVTLLFSDDQYIAAAAAYRRGLERRREAGLDLRVASVASVFVSRWDQALVNLVPDELQDQLGIAIAKRCYRAYRRSLGSSDW